jgi:hypothetical protein
LPDDAQGAGNFREKSLKRNVPEEKCTCVEMESFVDSPSDVSKDDMDEAGIRR